ncbi:hypothetical protein D3C78_1121290 [compost metagenome]
MLYYIVCSLLVVMTVCLLHIKGISRAGTKGMMLAIVLCLLSIIGLAENVAANADPVANDGLVVSNPIAYMIIGEDGWSVERFKLILNQSLYLSLVVILAFAIVALIEAKRSEGK